MVNLVNNPRREQDPPVGTETDENRRKQTKTDENSGKQQKTAEIRVQPDSLNQA